MMDIKPLVSQSILEWISHVIGFPVSFDGHLVVKHLVHLTSLTCDFQNGAHIIPDRDTSESCRLLCTFLDHNFHFPVSNLFSVEDVANGIADDEEVFGLCLTVLLGCLQSKNKQFFMNAALELEMDKQRIIFHLVREPMTQLSADRCLTREDILTGFREVIPSPYSLSIQAENLDRSMITPLTEDLQNTPIKSVSNDFVFKRPTVSSSNVTHLPRPNSAPQPSEISGFQSELSRISSTGHIDSGSADLLRRPTVKHQHSDGIIDANDRVGSSGFESFIDINSCNAEPGVCQDSGCHIHRNPLSPPVHSSTTFSAPINANSLSRRPTKLSFMTTATTTNSGVQLHTKEQANRPSIADSPGGDSMDSLSLRRLQNLQPLASPLASVKHLLDSPMWSHKIRLREIERERRRLQTDLETERAYRDEAEHTVAEMRLQLDEACKRASEAEARLLRLTRQLGSHQDQQDELIACRTELSIREDEITRLKSRLNPYQDIVSHAKKLEAANFNLQQECADQQQKVDQLSAKLSEIKNRRLVCSELETLRSKLRDAETQLAQHLMDSESAENEARRQQEMYRQLRLQHSVVEMRLTAKSEAIPDQQPEQCFVPDGENLGAVLENEWHYSQSEIARVKTELSAANAKLSVRDTEIDQFTSRLSQLASDLEDASVQREMAEISLQTDRNQLQDLQSDVETLRSRLEAWHCSTDNIDANSPLDWQLKEITDMASDLCESVNGVYSTCVLQFSEYFSSRLKVALEFARASSREEERKVWEVKQQASYAAHEALMQRFHSVESELASCQMKYNAVEEQLSSANAGVQAQTQLASQLQKTVASLESEKSSIESELAELQERSQNELQASRGLLDSATSRLHVLEIQSSRYRAATDMKDAAVSTEVWANDSTLEIPDDMFEADELDEIVDHDNEGDEIDMQNDDTCHSVAYEAMAADRRGLSDELVRLHDELSEANNYGLHLQQQMDELQEKLITREEDLCRQTALLARAQENWAIAERELRNAEQKLIELRTRYTMELQALGTDLLPQMNRTRAEASATAAQVDALRTKLEAERVDSKAKLDRMTYELDTLSAEKRRLLERNDHLQRELDNLRSLVIKMATNAPCNNGVMAESLYSDRHRVTTAMETPVNISQNPEQQPSGNDHSSLEKWLEATHEDRLRRKETQQPAMLPKSHLTNTTSSSLSSSYPYMHSNGRCSEGDGLSHGAANRVTIIRYPGPGDLSPIALGERYDDYHQGWTDREVVGSDQQVRPLSSHTTISKSNLKRLQPSPGALTDPGHSSGLSCLPPPDELDSIGYSAPLLRLDRLQGMTERKHRQQQPVCGNIQELDTDGDSSAYTDLSQVSSRSHPSRRLNQQLPSVGCRGSNYATAGDAPYVYATDHNVSPRKQYVESTPVPDLTRITELHRRNRLQPIHLRTSYPVETQSVEPIQVVDALGHLSTTTDQSQQKSSTRPRTQDTHVLREMGEDNQLFGQAKDISPAAAGYRELPKEVHSMTDALIAGSDDRIVATLSEKLSQTSIQAAVVATNVNSKLQTVTPLTRPRNSLDDVEQFTRRHQGYFATPSSSRLPGNSRPSSGMWIPVTDENVNPPQQPPPYFTSDRFARPAAVNSHTAAAKYVSYRRVSPPSDTRAAYSSSDDALSVCSSMRSGKSSVAFEIPIHDGEGKTKRGLPPRRVLSSSQQTGYRGGPPARMPSRSLAVAATLPRVTASRHRKPILNHTGRPSVK